MMSYPPFIFSLVHAKLYQRSDYILLNISPYQISLRTQHRIHVIYVSRVIEQFLENIEFLKIIGIIPKYYSINRVISYTY